jgi:FeS assembly SUF system protein
MEERKPTAIRSLDVVNPNDKVSQLRQAFARDGARSAPPPNQQSLIDRACDTSKSPEHKALEEKIIAALKTVYDPEIPVDIYELGLIYEINIADDRTVRIKMTLTAPGCPVAGMLVQQVEQRIEEIDEVKSCHVDLVWDPPWDKSRMSEAALLDLGLM